MYDFLDTSIIPGLEEPSLKESDIPEPMDNWTLEDFQDLVPVR